MKAALRPRDLLENNPAAAWILVLAYSAAIYALSSMPNPPQPVPAGGWLSPETVSTAEHIMEYSVYGFLLAAAYRSLGGAYGKRAVLLTVAAASLYGLTDEIHQYYVPQREFSLIDLSADCLGSFAGAFVETYKRR